MKKLLLLPSAKLAPPELRVDFGDIPSGMVPLNSKPALHYVIERHARAGGDTVVAAHEQGAMIAEYLGQHPGLRARAVDVGPTSSIGETVLRALEAVGRLPESLAVHFADTLITEAVPEGDVVVCAEPADDGYRWTAFEFDEAGDCITAVFEKDRRKEIHARTRIFVGAFSFTEPDRFVEGLVRAVQRPSPDMDPFYAAVVEYFNATPRAAKRIWRTAAWLDFGHLDTYYATKQALFLNARCFNTLTVDPRRGVVRKASADEAKLAAELEWYRSLPAGLEYLAPRLFAFSTEPGNTFAELEFYGYPALNDVYVYGQWDAGVWSGVLEAIGHALRGMQAALEPALTGWGRRSAMRQMYEEKTAKRAAAILEDPRFSMWTRPEAVINGRRCMGLGRVVERLPEILEAAGVYRDAPFTVIHGDLCLSNILYDRRNSFVRLIDPRGSFGAAGVYGDPRYDLAKLAHSLEGDYDLLLNGLFDLETTAEGVAMRPRLTALQKSLKPVFHRWMRARCGEAYRVVKTIEGLLFLSMVPLHSDRDRSQFAFLARGLELLQDALDRAREGTSTDTQDAQTAEYCYHDGR